MSFILDALRRAQSANEHAAVDAAPILADQVPDAPADQRRQVLMFAAAALTLVTVAILAWWFGRESASPGAIAVPPAPATAPATQPPPQPRPAVSADRAPVRALDQEAARARPAPAPAPRTATTTSPTRTVSRGSTTPGTVTVMPAPAPESAPSTGASAPTPTPSDAERNALPGYENLFLEGKLNLPNLKLDMLVYNRQASKRFVFINFKKYREGDTLDRKTAIEEITPRGAVLNHSGERFLLEPN